MLRRLARWDGARILTLWIALVITVGALLALDSIASPLSKGNTVLSPEFFLVLAAMALVFYGLPLALIVLTILWVIARRRYGKPTPSPLA